MNKEQKYKEQKKKDEFIDYILNLCFEAEANAVFSLKPKNEINPNPKIDYEQLGKDVYRVGLAYLKAKVKNEK